MVLASAGTDTAALASAARKIPEVTNKAVFMAAILLCRGLQWRGTRGASNGLRLHAGGVSHAFLGEAVLRRACQFLVGGLGIAARLRILCAFRHEAGLCRAGKLLGGRLIRARVRHRCGSE